MQLLLSQPLGICDITSLASNQNVAYILHASIGVTRLISRRCESDKCGTFQAKNALRRKKKIESLRDGKETALENIRHMLRIIQQVESDKMVRINVVTPLR